MIRKQIGASTPHFTYQLICHSPTGIHMRTSYRLIKALEHIKGEAKIGFGGQFVDLDNAFEIMLLGVRYGDTVEISVYEHALTDTQIYHLQHALSD